MITDQQAYDRVVRARAQLLLTQPFWGTLALYLTLVEDPPCKTMATDGARLFYNPAFVHRLPERQLMGVIAHEVKHCALRHHTRMGTREHKLWNAACDYAINRDLVLGGFQLPPTALIDARFNNMSAEEIYEVLLTETKRGKPKPDYSACGEVRQAAGATDPAERAAADSKWQCAVSVAASAVKRQQGKLPGDIERLLKETAKSRTSWRDVIRIVADARVRTETSWSRPDRRMQALGYILPGTYPTGIHHVGVIVDVSGSMSAEVYSKIVVECQAMLDERFIDKLTLVFVDTKVQRVLEYRSGDIIEAKTTGGGGTDFAPGLAHFADSDVAALIYFTDLDCTSFGMEPAVPLLWCVYGAERYRKTPPFGDVVEMND